MVAPLMNQLPDEGSIHAVDVDSSFFRSIHEKITEAATLLSATVNLKIIDDPRTACCQRINSTWAQRHS